MVKQHQSSRFTWCNLDWFGKSAVRFSLKKYQTAYLRLNLCYILNRTNPTESLTCRQALSDEEKCPYSSPTIDFQQSVCLYLSPEIYERGNIHCIIINIRALMHNNP